MPTAPLVGDTNRMRRDYFTLQVTELDDDTEIPTVTVMYEGPPAQLEKRLAANSDPLEASAIDITYRLRDPIESAEPTGVVALANRMTGEYVFEMNASADDVLSFVDAARAYGNATEEDRRFRVVIETETGRLKAYDKSTLLVYDTDGELLRGRSLLPSGVEL